ncbi:MAG TPA: hypothetical protein VF815_13695 [Myxococcaceae bacterium]|jgi:hypothetical protein
MLSRILIVAVALLGSACTTAMYNGPRKPSSELATLVSDDSVISSIDGVKTPYSGGNFASFEVLPGEHSIGVMLNEVGGGGTWYSNEPVTICLRAEAGKTYRVQIERQGVQWRPYMVDDGSKRMVRNSCERQRPLR